MSWSNRVRRLIPSRPARHSSFDGPRSTMPGREPEAIREFVDRMMHLTGLNPEHIGSADFSVDGRPCGLELYAADRADAPWYIHVDRHIVDIDRRTLVATLHGLVDEAAIEPLGNDTWNIIVSGESFVADVLWRLLHGFCHCHFGDQIYVEMWWS